MENRGIEPNFSPDFLYTRNPMHCGFKALEIALGYEKAGCYLANHHQSIFIMAHLYNALKQTTHSDPIWPEMDQVIQVHIEALFVGAVPTDEMSCHKRFVLQVGMLPRVFANKPKRNGRVNATDMKPMRKGMKEGSQMQPNRVLDFFRQQFAGSKTLEQCLYQIEADFVDNHLQTSRKSAGSNRSRLYQLQLTPRQFLTVMEKMLPSAVDEMRIDYISLARKRNEVLRQVRIVILEKMPDISIPLQAPGSGNSNETRYIVMVNNILSDATYCRDMADEALGRKLEIVAPTVSGPQMLVAGDIMTEMLGGMEADIAKKA